ncbi:MAG: polysaccharide deacetylase, partial [Deltaproteobacteria bacterium]|nr:polysaccharide deacetylase [Kofleriaceae bacterium]
LPAIGTTLILAPPWLRARAPAAMRPRSLFNLELHGIDLIDAELDGIPGELVARQPDLRVPLDDKLAALDEVLAALVAERRAVTLRQAATWAQREAA